MVVVIPPAPGRGKPTELLLCWHHYRVSRPALATASAVVIGLDGAPVPDGEWPPATTDSPAG